MAKIRSLAWLVMATAAAAAAACGALVATGFAQPTPRQGLGQQPFTGPVMVFPLVNAERGRKLFAAKGCVICHEINRIGGRIGPPLDASASPVLVNPFEFAARMLRGAEAMIALQKRDLGYQIELNGDELADIIGFTLDKSQQRQFSESDIPAAIRALMHRQDL
jgi:mono/diheme cytochrome c family protein